MTKYSVNKKTGVLHFEGMCKESNLRPYEVDSFEDEDDI